MSYELDLVNYVINKAQSSSSINLDNARVSLLKITEIFENQNKGPLNVSKNMVITLHMILIEPQSIFSDWVDEFDDMGFSSNVKKLRELLNSDRVYRALMVEAHTLFSGRCAQLTRLDLFRIDQKILIFTKKKPGEAIPSVLAQEKQQAEKKSNVIGDLCYKYRV